MRKTLPSISIIVPVYNVAPFIEDCLASVARQTYRGRLECIIVDDCGTDNSLALVKAFLARYVGSVKFRLFCRQTNGGLSAARNDGMRLMTGDYVYFLDSDDELTPDCMERLSRPLEKADYDIVVGDYQTRGTDRQYPPMLLPDGEVLRDIEVARSYLCGKWYMMACGKLYNTGWVGRNALAFREGIIHEDELWSFQAAYVAHSLVAVAHKGYIYKLREGSITTSTAQHRRMQCWVTIVEEAGRFVSERGLYKSQVLYDGIQQLLLRGLSSLEKHHEYELMALLYKSFRRQRMAKFGWLFRHDILRPRKFVRDFHYLLPGCLGRRLLFFLLHHIK